MSWPVRALVYMMPLKPHHPLHRGSHALGRHAFATCALRSRRAAPAPHRSRRLAAAETMQRRHGPPAAARLPRRRRVCARLERVSAPLSVPAPAPSGTVTRSALSNLSGTRRHMQCSHVAAALRLYAPLTSPWLMRASARPSSHATSALRARRASAPRGMGRSRREHYTTSRRHR